MRATRFARNKSTSWAQVALTAGLLIALFAVGQNALTSQHGLLALMEKRQEIKLLEVELTSVEADRARIARDVELLSPPYVDQDLLDERARSELGYAREGELVIFRTQD